ncbi:hypothetical protein NX059_012240 [Plenodomus lindquistii]|nr:hypothetical protein NX059_012240 [Plenodomus lindquistii]
MSVNTLPIRRLRRSTKLLRSDAKYTAILKLVKQLEQSHKRHTKTADGKFAAYKVLIGCRAPVLALLHAIGLAQHFQTKSTPLFEERDIYAAGHVVTLLGRDMNFRTRTAQINAFNRVDSSLRYLVTSFGKFGERVTIVGVNHVIIDGPVTPTLYKQFMAQNNRFG